MTTPEAPRRALLLATDIESWSGRKVPEQIRAQQALLSVLDKACVEAGIPLGLVQVSGDGALIIAPSDIDETSVVPAFVRGLRTAIAQENRFLAQEARIRIRLSLATGVISPGATGFAGPAVVQCFRLLDSRPLKDALRDFGQAHLAVIVSETLYTDVISNDYGDLAAKDFWQVEIAMPDKAFTATGWIYVSDQTGGPVPGGRPPGPAEPPEAAEIRRALRSGDLPLAERLLDAASAVGPGLRLDLRARLLIARGRDEEAVVLLDRLLSDQEPPGSPVTLLLAAQCTIRLGRFAKARTLLAHLLEHHPGRLDARLEMGRVELALGRRQQALEHLTAALRLAVGAGQLDRAVLQEIADELGRL